MFRRSFSFLLLENTECFVIAGLVPVIHVLLSLQQSEDVDGRDKPGHDGVCG
jgi:hypothetical protein